MQPSTNGQDDWQCACMQADRQHYGHLLWASHKTRKESWTNKVKITWFIVKKDEKMFLYCWLGDFKVHKFSQGKVCTPNRYGGKINHLSMACSLGNICTRNYSNWTTTVIVGGWVVSFFGGETPYILHFGSMQCVSFQYFVKAISQ